jgi:hypothetical protein
MISINNMVFVMVRQRVLCAVGTEFFSAFAKLRKAAINFVMSVRLCVRMEQLGSLWTNFRKILF